MIKFVSLISVLLMAVEVRAQEVIPLFRNDSLVTLVDIPFSLRDNSQAAVEISRVEISSTAGKCKGLVDPFIKSNFIIKCSEPDTAQAAVFFSQNGQTVRVNYGPVAVTAISVRPVVQPDPPEDPSGPDYSVGEGLYRTKQCIGCHTNVNLMQGTQADDVRRAIANPNWPMQNIQLTDAELDAIILYLNNL